MEHYSSSGSSVSNSPPKAYIKGELKDAKKTIAQKDEAIRQLEARLQRLEENHATSNNSAHGMRHSHRSPSKSASNHLDREEESDGGRYHQTHQHHRHHHRERRHHEEKLYLPYVKLPPFSGEGDPNVYLGWEAKCECTVSSLGVDQRSKSTHGGTP